MREIPLDILYDGTQPEKLKFDMSWDVLLLNLYLTNLLDYKAWQLIKKIHPFSFFIISNNLHKL